MIKPQYKPKKRKTFKNILHYSVYIVKPFRSSFAIACFDTMQQVLKFLNVAKLNYAKTQYIKALGFNEKQIRNFYKKFDKIYDINTRLTIHIDNFSNFIKPIQNLNKEFIIVTKTYFNHFNNKR